MVQDRSIESAVGSLLNDEVVGLRFQLRDNLSALSAFDRVSTPFPYDFEVFLVVCIVVEDHRYAVGSSNGDEFCERWNYSFSSCSA